MTWEKQEKSISPSCSKQGICIHNFFSGQLTIFFAIRGTFFKFAQIDICFNFLYNKTRMNKIKIQKQNSERIKITFPNYNYS